jgi:hypothetical protein
MKKSLERDLGDLVAILEDVVEGMDVLPLTDLIDLAARLKPVAKHCKEIDEATKGLIKKKLKNKEGTVLGTMFKAVLKLIPIDRLNQTKLKEDEPEMYAAYVEKHEDKRITFEVR